MLFFAHYGAQINDREGTKFAKGHLCALMGHLALYIRALIATTEPGNCPRDSYFSPLMEHTYKKKTQNGQRGTFMP